MLNTKKQINSILNTIEGGAAFYSSGNIAQIPLGLHVEGYGEIPFPFQEFTYHKLLKYSKQAPFGKGSQTITNTSIRNTREIDGNKLSFKNPVWESTLQKIIASVKKDLAIENKSVHASLYKLLIYKEGDFFLPHKDSEKEKGMFGSLVIGLPAKHTGGELEVKFNNQTKTINFSKSIDNYKMPYTAFYTDCEHEIKKITLGYRVSLVYNLIQTDDRRSIKSPSFAKQINELVQVLKESSSNISNEPSIILLNHQYTPANFSFSFLKRNDAPQAEVLFQAAEQSGYYASLCLLTCYQMGELLADYDYDHYSYRNQYSQADGEIGEIYEEDIGIEHWAEDGIPGLGYFSINPNDIITDTILKDDEPLEKHEEGFTGNAGMTMEYWYHYGAIAIWPKENHIKIIRNRSVEVKLKWLSYYLFNWNDKAINDTKFILKKFYSSNFSVNHHIRENLDYSVITKTLIKLEDSSFTSQSAIIMLLSEVFQAITTENWVSFMEKYPSLFNKILSTVGISKKVKNVQHLSLFLKVLSKESTNLFHEKGITHIHQLPTYMKFDGIYKSENRKEVKELLEFVVHLSTYNKEEEWINNLLNSFTDSNCINRSYVNKVLINTLLTKDLTANTFAIVLCDFCLNDLEKRTVMKPEPPENWTRRVPNSQNYKKQWAILKDFIESPTQRVFNYTIRQSERTQMENAIRNMAIDLKCETIRKGSPYTLKITKTQKAYEKKLKKWNEDMRFKQQLKTKFFS